MTAKRTQVNVRLAPLELAKVKASADALGVSVGKYSKRVLLKSPLIQPTMPIELQREVLRQLSGMANNLNQLAHQANQSGQVAVEEVRDLRKEVNNLWQLLRK